jgi:biotin-dependent carboxylase-like uncharacterized protein
MLIVLAGGPLTTVQDLGRVGHRALGIGSAGAMDRLALTLGNVLLGNPRDAAGIEIAASAFTVGFETDTWFALTGGDCRAQLEGAPILPWWAMPARKGQVLSLCPPAGGMFAYLTVAGGIDVAPILGSRSTDLKGRFGGFNGRALTKDDVLPTGVPVHQRPIARAHGFGIRPPTATRPDPPVKAAPEKPAAVVRVLPAAEYASFPADRVDAFWTTNWSLQHDSSRVGYRLAGSSVQLAGPLELFSHGILPGVVQVPPSGQPVVQMADANTCGGYPKIGVVITADLGRLAQVRPGGKVRFMKTTHREAVAAIQAENDYLNRVERFVSLAAMSRSPA